jgi:hypothetical protein
VSEPFIIDNTPPEITGLTATRQNQQIAVQWKAADVWNNIKRAEYSLDGGDWTVALPVTGLSDSPELSYQLTLDKISAGEHMVAVRVQDDQDNQSVQKAVIR